MKRVQILKLYSQTSHLKRKFKHLCSINELSTRQFSNGSEILGQKFFSPLCQSMSSNEVPGIIKSELIELEQIPTDITIDKFIWENMDQWPNHIAVECGVSGQKYSYSQLSILTKKFAVSLQKRGYNEGQVISTLLPNMPDQVVSVLGSIEAGLIVSPINPTYTPYELSHQLYDCGASVIVTLPDFVGKVKEAEELIRTKHKVDYKLDIIVINHNLTVSIPEGVSDFKELISSQVDHSELKPNNRTIDDIAILPYSSGTTGLAKGVQLTHRNCVSNCLQIHSPDILHYLPTTKSYQDIVPTILPMFHIYGFTILMLRPLRYGAKMVTLPRFEVPSFLSALKNHRATLLYLAPPIVLFLGSHPQVTDDHLASTRIMCNGAGPVSQTDADRVLNRFKSNFSICQGYGLTETSPVICVSLHKENDVTSTGKLVRSTSAKIIKADGSIGMTGEHGEICMKGPQVMVGYHKNPKATKDVLDDEGYFHTGDIGYYDENGKFYIVDRLKELIKVRGFQVPPAELEGLLRSHNAVADAAVIGIPDAKTGEKPLAFVVAKSKDAVKASELMDFVSSKVAPYKKLSNVIFVDAIPKSQAGKILRRILKEKYVKSK